MKKIIYIDMDDCIADFGGHPHFEDEKPTDFSVHRMYEPGFFLSLKPVEGAHSAVRALIRLGYDVQILSQPVAESAHSYSEKVQWIGLHFPELVGKINFSQDKGNFVGHYLIDDNPNKWMKKFEANGGEFVTFDYHEGTHAKAWADIVDYFRGKSASDTSD